MARSQMLHLSIRTYAASSQHAATRRRRRGLARPVRMLLASRECDRQRPRTTIRRCGHDGHVTAPAHPVPTRKCHYYRIYRRHIATLLTMTRHTNIRTSYLKVYINPGGGVKIDLRPAPVPLFAGRPSGDGNNERVSPWIWRLSGLGLTRRRKLGHALRSLSEIRRLNAALKSSTSVLTTETTLQKYRAIYAGY